MGSHGGYDQRYRGGAGGGRDEERDTPGGRSSGGGGVVDVPGRIMATLQRKFWDSNKIVSDRAVWARDFLAGAYMASKDKAGEVAGATVHHTLQAYKFARDQSTTIDLPGPLKPVRDHVLIPSFRGVERSVDFLLSPRLEQAYLHLREQGANLPLVGKAVFLPSVEAAEGVTRFVLVIVQAPLPSAERVANVAEVSMDVGKRGLSVAFRELYFYMDLIDQQVTRTMTRAQWDILGYGPYANLPKERREEVVDRTCEKYLSLEHPIQRYEFLAHIRWHNAALHDDLVQTGTLRDRANSVGVVVSREEGAPTSALSSPFSGDAWLDPNAVWRSTRLQKRGCMNGVVVAGVSMTDDGVEVAWFWRSGGVWETEMGDIEAGGGGGGTAGTRGPWKAFTKQEVRRLERAFVAAETSACAGTNSTGAGSYTGGAGGSTHGASLSDSPGEQAAERVASPVSEGGGQHLDSFGRQRGAEKMPRCAIKSVTYQPTAGTTLDVRSYEVQPDDVLVDQGRQAVSVSEMLMRPVFWPFSGQGDEVCRAVWMQDTGSRPRQRSQASQGVSIDTEESDTQQGAGGSGGGEEVLSGGEGFSPYPLRAAAILEDAYQFLAWYLECRGAGSDPSRHGEDQRASNYEGSSPTRGSIPNQTVLLTVQVVDQLVQFRSLTDIVSVKRTLGGTFSVFGRRRVFRGIPAASNAPPTSLKGSPPAPGSTVSAGGSRKDGVEGEYGRVEGGGSEVGAEGADDRFRGGFGGDGCSAVVEATVVDEGAEPSDAYAAATEGKVNGDDSLADDVKAVSTFAAAAVDVTAAAEFSSAGRGLSLTGAEVSVAEVLSSPDAEAPQNETPQNGKMSHDEHRPVPGSVSKSNLEPLTTNDEKDAAEGSWTAERKEMAETDGSEKDVRRCTESVGLSCGDDDDNADLNERVEHLVLVVHGIGDALMSVDLGVVQLRSLVECCDTMRNHHEEVVLNSKHLRGLRKGTHRRHNRSGDGRTRQPFVGGGGMGRVEYLPIEWHTRFKGRLYRESGEAAAGVTAAGDDTATGARPGTPSPASAFADDSVTTAGERGSVDSSSANAEIGGDGGQSNAMASSGRVRPESVPSTGGAERHTAEDGDDRKGGESFLRRDRGRGGDGDGGPGSVAGGNGLSIWDITLPRAPTLRAFTNDTLLDILYFMSPEYHQVIIEEVTQEMNRVVALYRKHCRSWSGKVSVVAHSLGAIICFDIMANQPASSNNTPAAACPTDKGTASRDRSNEDVEGPRGNREHGPPFPAGKEVPCPHQFQGSTKFPALSTHVENLFCLGSPIGMFLMIRGQHRGLGKAFRLPGCRRLFNIFHPYDPVAFRLEPLLRDGRGDQGVPEEPVILPTWTGGLRVHYQVQQWWHDLWTRAWETKRQAEATIERSLEAVGLIDDNHQEKSGHCEGVLDSPRSNLFLERIGEPLDDENAVLGAELLPRDDADHHTSGVLSSEAAAKTVGTTTGSRTDDTGIVAPSTVLVRDNADGPFSDRGNPRSPSSASVEVANASLHTTSQLQRMPPAASNFDVHPEREQSDDVRRSPPTGNVAERQDGDRPCAVATGMKPVRSVMSGIWESGVVDEDVERNGALAGGRRVDYCLQEKEFEVTNEYIFALGSHVIYWSSKDVSLFVAQQVVADATAEDVGAG